MTNEAETVTITQTLPDGTETKIEISKESPGNTDDSMLEEIIDAIFDDSPSDQLVDSEQPHGVITDIIPDQVDQVDQEKVPIDESVLNSESFSPVSSESVSNIDSTDAKEESPTDSESTNWDLQQAEYYHGEQERLTSQGDYEGAREAAGHVAGHLSDAETDSGLDQGASEAKFDQNRLDNAAWKEEDAKYYSDNAEAFAREGNIDAAEDYGTIADEGHIDATYDADSSVHSDWSSGHDSSATDFSASEVHSAYDDVSTDISTPDVDTSSE